MSLTSFNVVDGLALAAVILLVAAFNNRRKRNRFPYPPGPRGLPILGSLLSFPGDYSWLTFAEWGKQYGDIMSVRILGKRVVILNSPKAAKDLLEKRANIYSDRHVMPFYQMMGWDWFHPTTRYSEFWKAGRKILDQNLRTGAVAQYRPMQIAKTAELLGQLLSDPESFLHQIELYQSKVLMSLSYGYDVKSYDDHLLVIARKMAELGSTFLPGTVLVNEIPLLRHIPAWVPWLSYKPAAQAGYNAGQDVLRYPMEFVREGFKNGTARSSLALENLKDIEKMSEPDKKQAETLLAAVLGSLYTSGSDSASVTISAFFRLLALHPEVQKRAQKEVDAVTGGLRLPNFEDRPDLPYIDALCKETLRWRMATPVGVPHATTQDDVYEGYFIPKGTTVIANAWGMLHDPVAYPEPFSFKPERFLNPDGTVRDDPLLSSAFGFGRRICPARHFVDSTLFILASSVSAVFDVGLPKDDDGNEVAVKVIDSGTLTSRPFEFKCSIAPRDERARDLIVAANMAA
ncbi:cytochrome P450 [Gloeopeniophorella convolvens]|nr:cytochrome P450 [Gloeopeniophorella convolvens]